MALESYFQGELPYLKCLRLSCDAFAGSYSQLVVPLLRRMSNLEEVNLNLEISGQTSFIDGNDLRNLVDHMAQLKRLTFNIQSRIDWNKQVGLPSNASILKTFENWKFNQVVSWMDSFPAAMEAQFHIRSSPYRWKQYYNITNQFPDGLFQSVREISLFDERPFEHEFFVRIAQKLTCDQ